MDIIICGGCRVRVLPRLVLETQWGLLEEEPKGCHCMWDDATLRYCSLCDEQVKQKEVTLVGRAEGWQVRRFYGPLRAFKVYGAPLSNYAKPIPAVH